MLSHKGKRKAGRQASRLADGQEGRNKGGKKGGKEGNTSGVQLFSSQTSEVSTSKAFRNNIITEQESEKVETRERVLSCQIER